MEVIKKMITRSVQFDKELYRRISIVAAHKNIPIYKAITQAVEPYILREEKKILRQQKKDKEQN